MQVLVVDDTKILREQISCTLKSAGYEVEEASDGLEAWEKISKGKIRLVVSDWVMPRMSGIDLCAKIRQTNLNGYVYILLLTSRNNPEDVVTGINAGADDFLTKPFNPEELKVRVRAGERILSLETRNVAIFALAKLAESRDPETGLHLERIREYCRIISIVLQKKDKFKDVIDNEFISTLYLTSPLHDIGKVGVPDSVLLKPGRLSDEEFEIMKEHSIIGGNTLAATVHEYPGVAFLEMACEVALRHHERFDGTGYPGGLVGEDIPLSARIVAITDVYDALTSKRIYKKSYTHIMAHNMIMAASGKHFDPDIVDAFVECEKDFGAVKEKLAEKGEIYSE